MAVSKIYNGSSWITGILKSYTGSSWADKPNFHDGSSFEELYPTGPGVDAVGGNITRTRGITCYAGIRYDSDGDEYESPITGAIGINVNRGTWLTSGLTSEVWMQRTINSGSLYVDAGSGRLAMTTSRTFQVRDTSTTGGPVTCNLTIDFYDAASGGNLLDSVTYTLSAERLGVGP